MKERSCTHLDALRGLIATFLRPQLSSAGLGFDKILSFCTLHMYIPCSQTGNSTQFMRGGVEGQAHSWSQVQVVLRDSSWRTEAKVLQQSAEEDEELHLGQTLSQTHPATCERQRRKRLVSSAKKRKLEGRAKVTHPQKKA